MQTLVIGSSVIDLFLGIENSSRFDLTKNSLILNLGDKIPINIREISLGGNGANVAVGLQKLGINTVLSTYLGQDLFSREIEGIIREKGVELIVQEPRLPRSSFSFILSFKADRIIFSHHEKAEFCFYFKNNSAPDFVYLTSIGHNFLNAYRQVLDFVKNRIPLGFNPGTHQLEEKSDIVLEAVKNTQILFVNLKEAKTILSWVETHLKDPKEILDRLQNLGAKVVSITNGGSGAYAIDTNHNHYFIPSTEDKTVDKTGAGDAYTSGFLSAYLLGRPVPECMRWGGVNAYAVLQKLGAQEGLLTHSEIERILEERKERQVEKI